MKADLPVRDAVRAIVRGRCAAPVLAAALVFGLPAALAAEGPAHRWTAWMFQGENDAAALFSGSDEFYTTGTRLFALRHPDLTPPWAKRFAERWQKLLRRQAAATTSVGFAVGQNFYTPDDISIPQLIPGDRPYAGWLYGALLLQIADHDLRRQHAFEAQLGILGPSAGAEWVQTEFHRLIGDQLPQGWDNQLPDEPGVNVIYRYQRRVGRGTHFDVVPHFGGALGTVMVMANAGATVRAGWNISGFPGRDIPITVDLRPAAAPRPPWELYVFAGVDGRAVAHNVFLDGNVFRDSHSVTKEDFVYDLRAGFSVRRNNWRFQYAFVRRSEEFFPRRGRFDGLHDFGSVTVGVERAF